MVAVKRGTKKAAPALTKRKLKARSPSALPAKLKTGAGAHKDQSEKRRSNRAAEKKKAIEEQEENS